MSEKIGSFTTDYKEIPRFDLALGVAADALLAANRLLWKRGIALKFDLVARSEYDKEQLISCKLVDCPTGPEFY